MPCVVVYPNADADADAGSLTWCSAVHWPMLVYTTSAPVQCRTYRTRSVPTNNHAASAAQVL